jgi:FMN-dependent NADH-azoreductase
MKQILVVKVSPRGTESASRTITERLTTRLHAKHPDAKIVDRDLGADLPPHLDAITVKAISTKDPAEAEKLKASASLSDKLIEELLRRTFW